MHNDDTYIYLTGNWEAIRVIIRADLVRILPAFKGGLFRIRIQVTLLIPFCDSFKLQLRIIGYLFNNICINS